MKQRILVCGGRDFNDKSLLFRILDAADKKYDIECIIHGAARGADRLAGEWARAALVDYHEYPANWNRDGRAAGPIRNQWMLTEAKPTLVIAFPGGSGTRDMVQRSKKAGVPVIEVPICLI